MGVLGRRAGETEGPEEGGWQARRELHQEDSHSDSSFLLSCIPEKTLHQRTIQAPRTMFKEPGKTSAILCVSLSLSQATSFGRS